MSLSQKTSKRLLIAGGGTGGHILAGIAIADEWKKRTVNPTTLFVGAAGRIEEKLVPREGYELKTLQLGSLNRVSLNQKLKTTVQLPFSFLKAAIILLSFRPDVIVGVGGYSSGPVLLVAAVLKRLRLISSRTSILEQNSIMGMTNRILSRLVDVVFAAFPLVRDARNKIPVVITGNPIRSSMKAMPPAPRDPFTIFIFGGSQGALGVNSLVLDALHYLSDLKSQLKMIHQTGEKDFERVSKGYERIGYTSRVEKFIYDMPAVYAESSLLICRAGSSTLSEIATIGRAAILIPLPTAADNHQEVNAKVFSDQEAAYLLRQTNSNGEQLARMIRELVQSPEKIQSMENKVKAFSRTDAAEKIVECLKR